MVDPKKIESIRIVGMQKKKDHASSKHYEFILRVKWSNKMEITIYRPYSMFFDFQGVLCEMFKEKYSIIIPPVPGTKFHWMLLGKLGIEKECKSMEEFCNKIINLPQLVSQSMVVLHFFDAWGTDIRALNQTSTDIIGEHGLGSPVITSQSTSSQSQDGSSSEQEVQYRAIAAFTATNSGEISFEEDSILTVIEKTERGWWFVWNEFDEQGWAPATFLEPIGAENEEDGDEWMPVDDSNRAHLYTTVMSCSAQNPDEITYDAGEEVEVVAKSNYGWWKIRYGDKVGLTPATNLKRKDEEYTSPANLDRTLSISSNGGLYAVIRKAPPRKDSVRKSGDFNSRKGPSRFVYSAASFSGGKFVIDDQNCATFTKNSEGQASQSKQKQEKSVRRAQSTDEPLQSYENVDVDRKMSSDVQATADDASKGIKVKNVEFYTALADYTAKSERSDDLSFKKGDVMKLLSVDAGWYLVELHSGGETKQGWVPSTYVERNWNIDLEKMNLDEKHQAATPPAPKPKPRPRPKARDKPDEITPPTTPPVPTRRADAKQHAADPEMASPPSSPLAERIIERPKLPLPIATTGQVASQHLSPTSTTDTLTSHRQDDENQGESIYDEPEAQLRSVYDAESWFYGKISRQECEQMLKQHGRQQEFMIRESTRGSGSYALSVKYCYRIRHFPIETTADGKLLIGKLKFTNLIDIVNYYKENPLFYSEHKEPITLGNSFKQP